VIEVSVVPVASKNTKKGEMPEVRTVLTFSVRGPLATGHEIPGAPGTVAARPTPAWKFEFVAPTDGPHAYIRQAEAHANTNRRSRTKRSSIRMECHFMPLFQTMRTALSE
jgi:hypothetical protein